MSGHGAAHLCIDMQNLLKETSPWPTPWAQAVLPQIIALTARMPERTIFTRFIPPRNPADMPGTWRRFYEKWRCVTREFIDGDVVELLEPLREFTPPARLVDKMTYSAFSNSMLQHQLLEWKTDTLIVTGAETDVCVLATVLAAIDRGYKILLPVDAVCSSSDECHDSLMTLYRQRFSEQVETVDTEYLLSRSW